MAEDGIGPKDAYGEEWTRIRAAPPRGACPYADGSSEAERWYAGWDRQQLNEGDFSAIEG